VSHSQSQTASTFLYYDYVNQRQRAEWAAAQVRHGHYPIRTAVTP